MWASLLDYFNFKRVFSVVLVITLLCLASLHIAVLNKYSYGIVVCLTFMTDGAMWSMLPVASKQVFGVKRSPDVYSYLWSSFGAASMLGAFFVKTAQDQLGYDAMIIICAAFTSAATIITYFYRFKRISYAELAAQKGI